MTEDEVYVAFSGIDFNESFDNNFRDQKDLFIDFNTVRTS